VVINLFNGNKHIKESKKELNDFKAEIKNYKETVNQLKGQRSEIINEITEYGRGIFKDYLVHYKIKAAREELETLIMVSEPDERKVFEKLSLILEHPDNLSLQLYIKCMEKFPDNTDVRRLSLRGIRIYSDKNTKPNNV
jgi:septal ring factor EnvC (AmiA/AmiB activator)